MKREFSAGGVLIRTVAGRPHLAAVRPQGKPAGTWVLPKVLCTRSGTTYSSFWVGLGGFDRESKTVEQIGTHANCIGSLATDYVLWYEIAPAPAVRVRFKVFPGNRLAASVSVDDTTATVRLDNLSRRTWFQKRVAVDAPDLSSAKWIAEAPTGCRQDGCRVLPLAQFGKVSFTRAETMGDGHLGSISDSAWTATPTWMVTDAGFTATNGTGGVPGPLSADGSAFTVAWQANVQPPGPPPSP